MGKNAIKVKGIVKKAYSSSEYDIELENGITIKSTISGKMRLYHIKILPGDKVDVEMSPYDLNKGRIIYRY